MPQATANLTNTQKFVSFVKLEFNLLNFNLLVVIENLFHWLNSVLNEIAVVAKVKFFQRRKKFFLINRTAISKQEHSFSKDNKFWLIDKPKLLKFNFGSLISRN